MNVVRKAVAIDVTYDRCIPSTSILEPALNREALTNQCGS